MVQFVIVNSCVCVCVSPWNVLLFAQLFRPPDIAPADHSQNLVINVPGREAPVSLQTVLVWSAVIVGVFALGVVIKKKYF